MTKQESVVAKSEPPRHLEALIMAEPQTATVELRELLTLRPFDSEAYQLLALALEELERRSNARGDVRTILRGTDMLLDRAARALDAMDFETAGVILRKRLLERPTDVDALHLMAKLADELNLETESEKLLRLALEFAPDFTFARIELARLLERHHRSQEARDELESVLQREPDNLFAKAVHAAALNRAGLYPEAEKLYEELLRSAPNEPALWITYGQILRTIGRSGEAVKAMRRATKVAPHSGEGWWNLANLKTVRFDVAEIAAMRTAVDQQNSNDYDRLHLHFALGKAYEDAHDAAEAFGQYDSANAICRKSSKYHSEAITADVNASVQLFSTRFFEERTGSGALAGDPIFVLGMPRAGSTLIEQILASHPDIEGTKELPDIPNIAKELGWARGDYFGTITGLDRDQFRALGEEYLNRTRPRRTTSRPFFVDKMPSNWLYVPLIHLLLPNAKIIDARRHPLACGFSNFKQYYAKGHSFSYDLTTIGHYYREYVRLMAHVDLALPGRVLRVIHERLVEDTEGEIRRMLDYLELPFDAACLRFHETERAVRTPSAEQVRRPISRKGIDQWRQFEQWLDPLKQALGPVLDAYPDVPDFASNS